MSAESSRAVFLSYASQDAEAAQRVCAALRDAGVEVWFALFLPVISVNTQARREGYFRREWKLAAQRTHTMADAKPFLLPVVIDLALGS